VVVANPHQCDTPLRDYLAVFSSTFASALGGRYPNARLYFDYKQFLQATNLALFGHDNHHMQSQNAADLLKQFSNLNAPQLRRLLVEQLTKQKLGLYWESNAIERDAALNANVVLPRLVPEFSHTPEGTHFHQNLIIEGDNFDSLRLLRATHAGKIRVIYIDPPYNTGNKDWVYN
jgi:adenine specific DNA methylase Mod